MAGSAPIVSTSRAQVSTTGRMAGASISASVRSWRGEKHRTRQRPVAGSATRRSSSFTGAMGLWGRRAAKSLSKANVAV